MKKILLVCLAALCLLANGELLAQNRTISGRVTAQEDGSALPGVNVLVKGTTTGTVTDSDGHYTLSVPENAQTLIFTFIGLTTTEAQIGGRTTVDVQMETDVKQLGEVVVTAMGIERSKSELGYASQQVSASQLNPARSVNVANSLSGKVAGLDIKSSNAMGGSTNVVIRGYKSISSNNQALFVVDGVPYSNANTNTSTQRAGGVGVDYGNIESVNVLKGAAATALYGSRAANGVIMITTKKGKKNSFSVVLNSGVTWGKIDKSTYARYQKDYGGGYYPDFGSDRTLDDGTLPAVVFGDDASYGPKFDPNLKIYQWDALDPFSPNYRKARPWVAAKNDPTTFYETAVASNQSISISAGTDKTVYKFGYTRSDEKGVLPNSTLDKNMFNFSSSTDLTSKLTITTSANYTRVDGMGRYGTGYNGRNPNQTFRQWWQTNVDIQEQKAAYFRNRQNVTWNWNGAGTGPLYSDNPYWSQYENYSEDSRDHFLGYTSVAYQITDWLSVFGRASIDATFDQQEERVAIGSASQSSYTINKRNYNESNYDFMLNFKKDLSTDFSLAATLGSSMMRSHIYSIRASTNGGLVVPRLYSLSNSVSPINAPSEVKEDIAVDGLFVNAHVGYKKLAYLEGNFRKDVSTTLPVDNKSYNYYSVAGNFVYSELLPDLEWLSNGKIRANYAEVGNYAPAQSIYDVYDKPTGYGSVPIFSLPNTKNNSDLKPERTLSREIGIEADFFNERVGFDLTYYHTTTKDQILSVSVTGATGYTSKWVNSGEMENKGIELALFAVPIKTQDFSWTVNFNFTRNRNKVLSLQGSGTSEVKNYPIASFQGGVSINAAVGEPYGVIRGKDFVYKDGQRVVNSAGYYQTTAASNVIIGDPNPDWLGGINNAFRYKNIGLSFLIDIRHGGDLFSLDQWYGEATGLYKNSVGTNDKGNLVRTPVSEGGGILLPGVQADGSINTVYGENLNGDGETPFGYAANGYGGAPHAWYIYDGSYVKLRELALTYSVPSNVLSSIKVIKAIDVSLVGRNLWIIKKNMEYSDPEESLSSGNANMGYQSGAYPAVKTYGFNVKLTF
jgi:TonB-linked SusC/RagA family outer membrane protein